MLKAKELILDFYLNFIYLFEPMIGEKLKPTTYQFEYYQLMGKASLACP